MYNNAYVKQLDTVYLPLGAGMYSPEQLLVQGPVMTVSVPTAMCIDVVQIRPHNFTQTLVSTTRASVARLFCTNTTVMHYLNVLYISPNCLHIPCVTSLTPCTIKLSPSRHCAPSQCQQLAHFAQCEHHQLDIVGSHNVSEFSM